MKNSARFIKLIADQYDGRPWLDVAIKPILADISAYDAARNIAGLNSIWQLVYHLTQWRLTLLKRMSDTRVPIPDDNYIRSITYTSEEAWENTKKAFEKSQKKLLEYLSAPTGCKWDIKPVNSDYSKFELINGILQHDAYHLGQIVLIKKLMDQGL